ncbi:MAG: ABC transporter substrate-binding protein [bacterium]|nr:ABC transporter substrate-binding protein [bacterium]
MLRLLGAAAFAVVLAACAPPPAARGDGARIVSLAPSVTEILFGLDAGARLVGVCGHCNFPPAVERLPRVGGYLSPSVEAVIAVAPGLVIAVPSPGNREAVRAIERAGIPVLVVGDRTLADLRAAIRAIAAAIGEPARGEALVARIDGELDAVRRRVAGLPMQGVLLVVGHRPLIVAGGGTLQDELLRVAGATNVAADVGQAFPQIATEVVVARAPDVILDAAMGTEEGGRDLFAPLTTVPAVANGRVVRIAPDALFRAGPRVGEAAAALATAIHPGAPG